jgi:hypothetical protein
MAIRIEKGIVAFKKNGSMIVFPDGNVGKDNEYLRFFKTPESKELAYLFADPKTILERLKEGKEEAEGIDKLRDWLYAQPIEVPEDLELILQHGWDY